MALEEQIALLVAVAFLPPLVYLVYIRFQERYNREPWGRLLGVFLFGATVSVGLALILEIAFGNNYHRAYDFGAVVPRALVMAVIGAPIIEELTKAWGVRSAKGRIREIEDGIVYGVAAGLGFSATENLFYEIVALQEQGTSAFIATAIVRSVTGSFLHATATGIVGFGMARMYLSGRGFMEVLPYYAVAVLLHAGFNLLASLNLAYGVGFLIIISFIAIRWTIGRIRHHDELSGPTISR
jgi:protease PrsW